MAVRLPEDPLLVPMDGILIEQVLVNLMENSVLHGKHTSKVEVSAEEEKDRVVFYVDDDGQGSVHRPFRSCLRAPSAREMRRAAIPDGIWASAFRCA